MNRRLTSLIFSIFLFLYGMAFGAGDTLHISARIPEQFLYGTPDTVLPGDFYVEIVWDYVYGSGQPFYDTLVGGSYILQLNGTGVTKLAQTGALPSPYDNVLMKNGFNDLTYWNTFGSPSDWPHAFLQTDYDGTMPDYFGHAFFGSNGYPGLPPMGAVGHYELHFTGADGGSIQVDSVYLDIPSFDWAFDVPATFSGINLPIEAPPDLSPVFDNCPMEMTTAHHIDFNFDFEAHDPSVIPSAFKFKVISGPGTIDSVTGVWTYDPPCSDVGQMLTLVVGVEDSAHPVPNGNECSINLMVTNSAPIIGGYCNDTLTVGQEGRTFQFTVADSNSSELHVWMVDENNANLAGAFGIDSTGLFFLDPVAEDAGNLYGFTIVVRDCHNEIDQCDFFLRAVSYICGDANGSGTVNILDITFLLAFLYKGGPESVPPGASDVNGNKVVNVLDVTYLISYLYKGGPVPICP